MKISRRGFLGAAGASTVGGAIGILGFPKMLRQRAFRKLKP
jgi:hypothetical protein